MGSKTNVNRKQQEENIRTMQAPGVFSLGFITNVLPAVHATGNIHSGIIAGKLNGALYLNIYVYIL